MQELCTISSSGTIYVCMNVCTFLSSVLALMCTPLQTQPHPHTSGRERMYVIAIGLAFMHSGWSTGFVQFVLCGLYGVVCKECEILYKTHKSSNKNTLRD